MTSQQQQPRMTLHHSKKNIPCLWENGGSMTNTGHATIIADQDGNAKQAIYYKTHGSLACGDHALIPVRIGDTVIQASHHRGDFRIAVMRIVSLTSEEVILLTIHEFDNNEWNTTPPTGLHAAIKAARDKATTYHCRYTLYANPPKQTTP